MIYRMETGAQSTLPRRLVAPLVTLILTIGLPIMGALITRVDFTPSTPSVSSGADSKPGEQTGSADNEASNTNANAVATPPPIDSVSSLQNRHSSSTQPLEAANGPADSPLPSAPEAPSSPDTPEAPTPTPEPPIPEPPLPEPPTPEPPVVEPPTPEPPVETPLDVGVETGAASLQVELSSDGLQANLEVQSL